MVYRPHSQDATSSRAIRGPARLYRSMLWFAALVFVASGCSAARLGSDHQDRGLFAVSQRSVSQEWKSASVRRTPQSQLVSYEVVKPDPRPMNGTQGQRVIGSQDFSTRPLLESTSPSGPQQQFPSVAEPNQLNFCDDFHNLPQRLTEEIGAVATWDNAAFLGTAAAGALVLRNNVDRRVIHDTELHGPRWGSVSEVLSHGGDAFLVHVPLLAGMYATSLYQQNDDLHELTLTMFTSYKISVLGAIVLQYATGTHRMDGGGISYFRDNGFPSESTAASFAFAAVIDERYGWKGGVPAYLLAGLIGFSEVDQDHHTISDVVFGAALGYAIGKSVGALRYRPEAPFKLVPLVDLFSGTQGMAIEFRY